MKTLQKDPRAGFTLIEMFIVVTMIAILATIAMPKLAYAFQKAREGSAKGNLGAIRGAIAVYHADTEGSFPADLAALTVNGRYLSAVPSARGLVQHLDSSAETLGTVPTDAGGWLYNDAPGSAGYGTVRVNCTHADSAGRPWNEQ